MKRLIKVIITQKFLETNCDKYKSEVGQEVTTENYQWSDNERDAIGQAMAEYLNIGLDNPDPVSTRTILEIKETSLKIETSYKGVRYVTGLSFTVK